MLKAHFLKLMPIFPLALVFYEIGTYLSNDMYLPSLPVLAKDFAAGDDFANRTLTVWFLGSASMQLIIGPLSDRFGRRMVLLSGGLLYIFSTLLSALTSHSTLMLIARFIQGSTVCSVTVAGYAAIHELYSAKTAIKLIAIMSSVTIVAPALGPLLGAVLIYFAHWRYIFYLLCAWAIISVVLLYKVMPETNPQRVSFELRKIIKDYVAILKNKAFLAHILTFCFIFLSMICWIVESPFIIIETYQKSVLAFGMVQFWVFSGFLVGAQFTRFLVHRLSVNHIIKIGLICSSVASLLLTFNSFVLDNYYLSILWMTLVSAGVSMAFGPLNRQAVEQCSQPMGRIMAIAFSIMSLFGVMATFIVSLPQQHTMNYLAVFITFGALMGLSIFHFAQVKKII